MPRSEGSLMGGNCGQLCPVAGRISKMRSGRTIAAHLIGRLGGTPGRPQIRRRERVLWGPGDRQRDGVRGYAIQLRPSFVGSKVLVEVFINHLGSCLCALSDRNRCSGPESASFGLPFAE